MANDVGSQFENTDGARNALASIGAARRRLDAVPPPRWLFGGLGICMLIGASVTLLFTGPTQSVLLGLNLVAIFGVGFAAHHARGGSAVAFAAGVDRPDRDHRPGGRAR